MQLYFQEGIRYEHELHVEGGDVFRIGTNSPVIARGVGNVEKLIIETLILHKIKFIPKCEETLEKNLISILIYHFSAMIL